MEPIKWRADELRDASLREPAVFAKTLQQALVSDFNSVFYYVKTQKLVLRSRLLASIAALELEMELWLRDAPLKGKQKAQLRRHFAVCKAIQQLLDIVDQQSANLRIWHVSTENLLRAVFAWVQDREKLSEEVKPSAELSDSVSVLRHMESQRMALRSACDFVTRVL